MKDVPNSVIDEAICEWIHSERDRRIMHERLIDGHTYLQIADSMQMSERQIKRIVYKCESIVFRHI